MTVGWKRRRERQQSATRAWPPKSASRSWKRTYGGLIVVDETEVDDDLVRDMTEIMTSFCARLYGRRSARNRARRALEAAGD